MDAKPRCKATTKDNAPCKAAPLTDSDFCLSHSGQEMRESLGFGGPQEGSGRPRKPRVSEIYAEVAEEMREEIREVLKRGLTATRSVVVGNGPTAHVEEVEDIPTQLKTASDLADRTDGKPRQAVEITGDEGGPVKFEGVTDADAWHREVAAILKGTGAHGAGPDQDE